jgi:VanZ family protein
MYVLGAVHIVKLIFEEVLKSSHKFPKGVFDFLLENFNGNQELLSSFTSSLQLNVSRMKINLFSSFGPNVVVYFKFGCLVARTSSASKETLKGVSFVLLKLIHCTLLNITSSLKPVLNIFISSLQKVIMQVFFILFFFF